MNKKAFTLTELLGVIVIISIILLLVMIPITKNLQEGTDTVYNSQIKIIEISTENWITDNFDSLPKNNGDKVTITVGTLKQEGFLEMDVKDPTTGECIPNNTEVTITKTENGYEIYVDEDSGTDECPDIDGSAPIIYLNGEALMYVEYGSTWVDPGATAKTSKGVPINEIKTEISGSGTTINTNGFNTYEITYSATDNGITVSTKRTVIIHDTTPPVITVPENTAIPSTQTSFNVLDGVTATDNADGNITDKIKVTGSVTPGILGEYVLTYEVEDSSGNKTSVTRKVTILDKNPPSVTATVQGNPFNSNGWAKNNFQIKVKVTDTGGSGAAGFKYCQTTSTTCTPSTNVSKVVENLTISTQSATNYVCIIPYDHAGNEGTKQCFGPYKLDKTKPVLTYVQNETIKQSTGTFTEKTGITFSDNLTPTNNLSIITTSNLNFATPGTYTIKYTVTDWADNTTTETRTITVVDDIKPTLAVSKSCANKGNGNWCKGNITVTLTPNDNATGIVERQYKINDGSWATLSGNTHTVTTDGEYTIYYRVKDGAGNYSDTKSVAIQKDSNSPSLTLSNSSIYFLDNVTSYDTKHDYSYSDNVVSNTYLASTLQVTGSVSLGSAGTYTITYKINDAAGNSTTKSRTIQIIQSIYDYAYTGNYQTFTMPKNGNLKLEVWGASGAADEAKFGQGAAGYGGYATGTKYLTANKDLYVYVGEMGKGGCTLSYESWNGGGRAGQDCGTGGGGASDMRTTSGSWDNYSSLTSRIIVAGGGGGGVDYGNGGYGGGTSGANGNGINGETGGKGGTQTSGYALGRGQDGSGTGAGGGGGYYGGYTGTNYLYAGGGGGGSGYIGGVSNGSMQNGVQGGHGHAKITITSLDGAYK